MMVAGSPGMTGAASLCARAALRGGAGYVRLGSPGVDAADLPATEATGLSLPAEGWADAVLADLGRFGALVVGPGLGRSATTVAGVRRLVAEAPVRHSFLRGMEVDSRSTEAPGPRSRIRTVLAFHSGESRMVTQSPRPVLSLFADEGDAPVQLTLRLMVRRCYTRHRVPGTRRWLSHIGADLGAGS